MKGYFVTVGLFFLGLFILLLDFSTKLYAYYSYPSIDYSDPSYPYGGIEVFRNILGIECSFGLVMNKGAAWGFFSDFQVPLVIVRIAVIVGMLVYLFFFNSSKRILIPFIFVVAGAFGNIIDYFIYGYVIDFIHFKFWSYDFPVFNLADTFITMGVVALFCVGLFHNQTKPIQAK